MDLESTQRAELTPAVPENNSPTYNHSSQNNSMSHDVDEVSFTTSNHSLPHCQLQNANPLSEPAKKITPAVMAKLLKGKDKEWAAVVDKKGSLQLLDLPVDVLKEIIKEVTHTNDLTSLALTHSALHNLAIPYIYSRFDIVWPDAQNTSEPRVGVDALTYGLATLVMRDEIFSPPTCGCQKQNDHHNCGQYGQPNQTIRSPVYMKSQQVPAWRRRRGNNFSQFTRKFSLGNGPADWVQEYLISKEGGKMLGTLVALAIARMPNLETFVWDMPTGVLRDVWSALSSLGDRWDGQDPRLEKIWIRWHDNKSIISPGVQQTNTIPASSPTGGTHVADPHSGHLGLVGNPFLASDINANLTRLQKSYREVEHPSFSILPALKSVTVLDIDEPAYLDEMSVLIERSAERLRELRVGAASLNSAGRWPSFTHANSPESLQSDSSMDYLTSGGMLGMIMSKLYDCRVQSQRPSIALRDNQTPTKPIDITPNTHDQTTAQDATIVSTQLSGNPTDEHDGIEDLLAQTASVSLAVTQLASPHPEGESYSGEAAATESSGQTSESASLIAQHDASISQRPVELGSDLDPIDGTSGLAPVSLLNSMWNGSPPVERACSHIPAISSQEGQITVRILKDTPNARPAPKQRKLRLEVLELERIPMCVSVLQKTVDWTVLTSLTLLNCDSDEELWKALRRTYTPRPSSMIAPGANTTHSKRNSQIPQRRSALQSPPGCPVEYRLKLKKIHTNTVSPALISFLKETLAPNSLEWMFLQDRTHPISKVTIDAIYRGPLRRHRSSLKKVMIDSDDRRAEGGSRLHKWKRWMLNREVLLFIMSGKMSCLRELAVSIDYKDWHYLLQHLPQISHLRSLYVPHIADHVYSHQLDPRELALQVVDIVALCPKIELCYLGISSKCFEILENRHSDDSLFSYHDTTTSPANAGPGGVVMGDPDDDSDADDEVDEDEEEEEEDAGVISTTGEAEETDSDAAEDSEINSDDEGIGSEDGKRKPRLKLREILFYDDKVSIFKARHAQL